MYGVGSCLERHTTGLGCLENVILSGVVVEWKEADQTIGRCVVVVVALNWNGGRSLGIRVTIDGGRDIETILI